MGSFRAVDLLIVGGGNAALCAALSARARGLEVLLIESAPKHFRGGNSRHTRNVRTMHDAPLEMLGDVYAEQEYWDDLVKVTGGLTDEKLARLTIRCTAQHPAWMKRQGVRFQPPLGGTLQLGRTNLFFLGGGFTTVAFLPNWIQTVSQFVPTSYAINGLRQALFYPSLIGFERDLSVLAGCAIVSVVLAALMLTRAWKRT